jgi:hypothetical protein
MKTEHEKLKEICDLIWYKNNWRMWEVEYKWEKYSSVYETIVNVRQIIFTPEFMEKYTIYCSDEWIIASSYYKIFLIDLHNNLTYYLYRRCIRLFRELKISNTVKYGLLYKFKT